MVTDKGVIRYMLVVSAFFMFADMACAQNLLSLSKEKRDSTLIAIAKRVCLRDAPEFYREYGKPTIVKRIVEDKTNFSFRFWPSIKK